MLRLLPQHSPLLCSPPQPFSSSYLSKIAPFVNRIWTYLCLSSLSQLCSSFLPSQETAVNPLLPGIGSKTCLDPQVPCALPLELWVYNVMYFITHNLEVLSVLVYSRMFKFSLKKGLQLLLQQGTRNFCQVNGLCWPNHMFLPASTVTRMRKVEENQDIKWTAGLTLWPEAC